MSLQILLLLTLVGVCVGFLAPPPSLPFPPSSLPSKRIRIDDFEDSAQNSLSFCLSSGTFDLLECTHAGYDAMKVDVGTTDFTGQQDGDSFQVVTTMTFSEDESFGDTVTFDVTRRYEGEWERVAGDVWAAQGAIWDEEGRKVGYFNALEVDDEVEDLLAGI